MRWPMSFLWNLECESMKERLIKPSTDPEDWHKEIETDLISEKGWKWILYIDQSGSLIAPDGKTYCRFDMMTQEYSLSGNGSWDSIAEDNRKISFKEFKEKMERYIEKDNRHWAEIRADYIDDTDKFLRIDAWKTGADEEEGKVIAYVDTLSGRVIYVDPIARIDAYAQELIKEASEKYKKEHPYDVEALEEMLKENNIDINQKSSDKTIKSDESQCFYLGMEDIVGNGFIELIEEKKLPFMSYKLIDDYGKKIVSILKNKGKRAILTISRLNKDNMLSEYSDFFEEKRNEKGDLGIALKDGKTLNDLYMKFRGYLAFDVLLAFMNCDSRDFLINNSKS